MTTHDRPSHPLHALGQARTLSRPTRVCWKPRGSCGVHVESVCGGRGICGRCQVECSGRRLRQARHHLLQRAHFALRRQRDPLRRKRDLKPGRRLSCSARSSATWSSTSRRMPWSTRRWCARIPMAASSSATRQSTCAMSRSKSPTCTSRSAISTACCGLRGRLGLQEPGDRRLSLWPGAADPAQGQLEGHRRNPR
jgi:ferredoxin